jgi:outer membrane protein assembly factor BamB
MIKKLLLSLLIIAVLAGLAVGCTGQAPPRGWSGETMVDGTLFLASIQGKLVAIDTTTHNRLFPDVTLPASAPARVLGCATSAATVAVYGTPAASEGLVYVGGYNGRVYAVSSISGELEWTYPREGNIQPIVSGMVVALGRVYFGSGGEVFALDAVTGDEVWKAQVGDKVWSTPAIAGDTLYVGSFDRKLYALDVATGEQKWASFATRGAIVSSPVINSNVIYVGSLDRHIYAVDAVTGEQVWQYPAEADDVNKSGNWFWANLVLHNNTIYAGNLDGKVYILDAGTGSLKVAPVDLNSPISSSPVLVDGTVIIATEEGKVYSLDTGTNEVKQLANVAGTANAPLFASAGVVYVHTQVPDTVYAVDVSSGSTLWSLPLTQ